MMMIITKERKRVREKEIKLFAFNCLCHYLSVYMSVYRYIYHIYVYVYIYILYMHTYIYYNIYTVYIISIHIVQDKFKKKILHMSSISSVSDSKNFLFDFETKTFFQIIKRSIFYIKLIIKYKQIKVYSLLILLGK